MIGLDRRAFFRLAGGGVVMLVGLQGAPSLAQDARRIYPEDFNAYLVIGNDGRVTVYSGKIEMGQGVMTSQAQMLAEELGVPLSSIDMVLGDTQRCPWDMGTFGSLTTRMFGPALRAAGAQARLALLALGAARLGVPREQVTAAEGKVYVTAEPARQVSYAELSRGARIAKVVDGEAVLRSASRFTVMGQSPARLDGVEKVTGAARYAGDIRLPGMLYARILRPPAHGATLVRVDTSAAEAMEGVRVLKDGDLIAVLHDDPGAAASALRALKAQWKSPPASRLAPDTIFDHLLAAPAERRKTLQRGDPERARSGPVIASTFRKGYVAHAPIETHTALADVQAGRATVWASTQTPFPTRDLIAAALKLPPDKVRVLTPYVGGGFGGKSASAQAVEAARLSRLAGRPVQVAWTRQEEFFGDTFDPAAVVKIASTLDARGRIATWDSVVVAAGERGSALLYDVPHARIELVGRTGFGESAGREAVHPFATGPWRAPGANMNVFAIESQMDLLAAAARADPVAFRLRHLAANPRMRRTLEAAARAFGWQPAPVPSGRGLGVACSIDAGTCVGTIAEVKVDRASGKVKVLRVVSAQDMGIVVNPEGARMQMEGGLAMGLGYALSEELRFRGGEILDRNFDSYAIPRFSDMPRIEAVLVKNDELAPQGGGEPSITTAGAALANAFADATGARVFRLPMTPQRVREALQA